MERGVAVRALVIIIGLVLLVCVAPLVYAHLGTPIDSGWASTTPTINGVIAVGEWSDATVRDFTLEMRDRTVGDLNRTLNGRLYVKNDWTRLLRQCKSLMMIMKPKISLASGMVLGYCLMI